MEIESEEKMEFEEEKPLMRNMLIEDEFEVDIYSQEVIQSLANYFSVEK